MKHQLLLFALGILATAASAQTFKEWQDPEVNAVNRLPMHTTFFGYESVEASMLSPEASTRYLSINGDWKFRWQRDAVDYRSDFFKPAFDDADWKTIPAWLLGTLWLRRPAVHQHCLCLGSPA